MSAQAWSRKLDGKSHPNGHTEAAACGSKRPFTTWDEAEDEVLRLIDHDAQAGHPERSLGMSSYRCYYCSSWHVGHSAVGR